MELAYSLATLALYDIIIYADDSGSMAFEEGGERIQDLKLMVGRVADVATMFDDDGILVRFMNGTLEGNGIRDSMSAGQLISQVCSSRLCPVRSCVDWDKVCFFWFSCTLFVVLLFGVPLFGPMTMLCWDALYLEALVLLFANSTAISFLRACHLGKLIYQTRHVKVVCPVHRCNAYVLLDNVAFWWPNDQPNLKSRLKFV